jgi:DNA invertase Pin-like site-specific DNA recombinase
VSTEEQQYSFESQADVIREYARQHGFEIVSTYSDVGRSGISLNNRPGIVRLLSDVVSGNSIFRAVLVYDVSRWGRFQDCDESAYYEFVCKSYSAPVHYCAETFRNDNTLPNSILKALKRTMAARFGYTGFRRSSETRRARF